MASTLPLMMGCSFTLVALGYLFFIPKLPSKFSTQFGQMLPAGKPTRSGLAFFVVGATVFEAIAFAFLGAFWVALAFLGLVAAATDATGCSALALGAGFGVTASGLFPGACIGPGFLGFAPVTTVATGVPVFALGAGFWVVAMIGFFIVGSRNKGDNKKVERHQAIRVTDAGSLIIL